MKKVLFIAIVLLRISLPAFAQQEIKQSQKGTERDTRQVKKEVKKTGDNLKAKELKSTNKEFKKTDPSGR